MKKGHTILLVFVVIACVEPIDFDIPTIRFALLVDGSITNRPGPHNVFVGEIGSLQDDLDIRPGILRARVTLFSDAGDQEVLTEKGRGNYSIQSQGIVGRRYWIRIELPEGGVYESEPELLQDPGELLSVTTAFEADTEIIEGFEYRADKFNILVNGEGAASGDNYFRWRTTGTHAILTYPHLIDSNVMGTLVPNPPPCSGWVVSGGNLLQQTNCKCCVCWITTNDRLPFVFDDSFSKGGSFRNVNVGFVPVTSQNFYEKYHLSVDQIALTKRAYDFFRMIRIQKEGASSLFLPPSGRLVSNIRRVDGDESVYGYFWAGGVDSKAVVITRDMLPYHLPYFDTLAIECNNLPNSTLNRPDFW